MNKENTNKVKDNLTYQERREEIRQLIIALGYDNIHKEQLAKRYGVSVPTIYNDIHHIMDSIPKEELERERAKVYYDFLNYDKHLANIIRQNRENPELLLKAIDVAAKTKERKGKTFEMFGLKEKVADKIEVSGGLVERFRQAARDLGREI